MEVAKNGDNALVELTERYDKVLFSKKDLLVSQTEIKEAYNNVDKNQISALKTIKEKIKTFETLLFDKCKISTSIDNIQLDNIQNILPMLFHLY